MNDTTFKKIFSDILIRGKKVSPRGQLIIELENYSYELEPYIRFSSFVSRKLSVDYIKQEFLWYLKGDKFDDSITQHAKLWKKLTNKDGSFNSNYGQYFFGTQNQFDVVIDMLVKDKDSRRASIVLLTKEHLSSNTNDVPCTYSINFRIRDNHLNMSVHMRSQDAIYGMGNDAPAFSFLHEMMYNALKEYYPDIEYGTYHHVADSFHVYEKHFEMIKQIPYDEYIDVHCPRISGPNEVKFLRELNYTDIPIAYKFTHWLCDTKKE